MPSKKKKYNARFPAGRIKKIMQSDEEIGKVAQAVPVIISRTLELFVESLLTKTLRITNARNAKTLSTSHMKQCIMAEQRFDFLRELVKNIPDISVADDEGAQSSPEEQYPDSDTPYDLSMPSTSTRARNNMSGPANGGGAVNYSTNSFQTQAAYNNGNSALNYCKRNSSGGGVGGGTTTPSVIMHTTSLMNADSSILNAKIHNNNKECLPPPKLNRSESTPAQISMTIKPKPIWRPIETSPTTPRKRLKQHQSMPPYGNNDVDADDADDDGDDNNHNNTNNPTARQKPPAAPIVNFDFCTKPIVKIDYSNLPITTTTTCPIAPLSAPVLGHHSELKAPDFSINAPIINIDLSNMMTAPVTPSSTSTSSSSKSIGPAVATISIGALPLPPAAAAAASPMHAMSSNKPSSLNMNAAAAATAVGSTKHNALLELDEDYDNI